jgi:predicted nucleic acid-binding protein
MVVLDASTLILVAKAEILDLFLGSVQEPVAIPAEVERECCHAKKSLDALRIQKAVDESRIEVVAIKARRLVEKLASDFNLGQGEAEAVSLALSEKARLLGMDDKNGINACRLMGIPFTTAIAILIRSREKGLLDGPDALARLALLAKFGRYSSSIIEDAKRKLEALP